MKMMTRLTMLLAIGALIVSAATIGARAQIPFAFQLNGKTFDAGNYKFESTQWHGVVAMVDAAGHKTLVASTPLGNPNTTVDPKLSFVRTKAGMSLSEVWINAGTGGYKLATPPAASGETVEVALARR
jgi:hypothetical protein